MTATILRRVGLTLILLTAFATASMVFIRDMAADDPTGPPAKPTGLSAATSPGSLDVSVDWDDVDGATHYSVRWRLSGPGNPLNEGVEAQSSETTITVSDYGRWVVRVEACSDAGCGLGSSKGFGVEPAPEPTPEPAPVVRVPARPTGLAVSNEPGSLVMSMDWDDVEGADEYRVRWRASEVGSKLNEGAKSETSDASITVSDYGRWVVRVEACNDAGCGPGVTQTVRTRQTRPGQPQGLEVSSTPGELDLTASWDEVEGATSYQLNWRRPSGNFEADSPTVATATSAVVTMSGYGQWVVRLEACNDAGCGPGATQTVRTRQAKPGRPQGLEVSATPGERVLTATWDTLEGADSYELNWRRFDGGFGSNNPVISTTTSATFLVPEYGEWVVRLEGCNEAGCGHGSARHLEVLPIIPEPTTVIISPPEKLVTPPPVPQALTLIESARGQVTLTWKPPADDGGSPVTGYNIVRSNGATYVTLAEDTASTSTSYVDNTVAEETNYYYDVRAINSAGVGQIATIAITTGLHTAGIPGAPRGLRVIEYVRGEVTLTWDPPADHGDSPVTGYNIVRSNGATYVTLAEDTASTSTSYVDNTVAEETIYFYDLRAINSAGVGQIATTYLQTKLQAVGVPGAPRGLRSVEHARGEVTLTWNPPANNGGSPVTGYSIVRSNGATYVTLAADTASTSTSFVDNTVAEETLYFYDLRAINSAGVGDVTYWYIQTRLQTEGVPGAPRGLRAIESVPGEVTLTWNPPADHGDSPITGYNIVRSNGGTYVTLAADTASTSTSYVDTTVAEETIYFYDLRAINSAGVGDVTYWYIQTKLQTEGVPGAPE